MTVYPLFMGLGHQELLLIFLIVLLLFGASRIPEVARAMGKGIRDFKRATREIEQDLSVDDKEDGRDRRQGEKPGGTGKETGSS